ncbi:hypothetical protein [Paenibacillus hexagrammi]|uniref:Uncharacterized protein n=1 Tax=Paenibacillus hexagrammi TaxID=2908839 RepID=A0ABY3SFJ7_9BACL|nr:hypothetical protein [Paenibacillus sp. YPD9-1]UJF32233.1 hypothetical protein L0M14_21285 [Paenibacillus sp. YPD9-1]
MNDSPYRLEQGYELGFGPSVYATMADVILAFSSPNEDILFSYANWDINLDPHKDYMIEQSAEFFHSDMIPDPKISQKVKGILLKHYAPDCDPKTSLALMESLMTRFKQTPLDELNEEIQHKIGFAVHEMQTFYTLEDRDENTQAFVKSRIVDVNSTWLLTNERPMHLKNLIWYRVNSKEEILRSFHLTDWWFNCAIVKRNTDVENFSYFLDYTEEHGEEHDGMVLYIKPSNREHFFDTVIPRLSEVLGDKLQVVR